MADVRLGPSESMPFQIAIVSATTTTITVVPASTATIVKVYKLYLISSGTSTIVPQDGTTALTGGIPLVANGSFVLDSDGTPWFVTSPGNAFTFSNTSGITISGGVYYTQNKYQA